MSLIRKFKPLVDRVLVERFAPELKTKGGILIPEKAQGKVLDATVVAVGPGQRDKDGNFQTPSVAVGDRVFLPEYGGTKIEVENKEYHLFREGDILGKWES
ncbi:10 kDa heat shock protein, mitochondrial-like [Amphiura filiformis]|uniref:10 kDa heat shock protein, mitochondrial-like n=1 Tax=Amphiura filiformis TaxID=82378 RepID=UPI003B227940